MAITIRRTAVMLAGLTLASGAILGAAAPASAATTASSPHPTVVASDHGWGGWGDSGWEFRGLYGSRWECESVGRSESGGGWGHGWGWGHEGGWGHEDYYCARSDQWRPGWDNNRWGSWRGNWDRGEYRRGAWALYVRG